MNISQIIAIYQKEMRLNLRFKWNYFGNILSYPLRFIVFFLVVYRGFFASGVQEISGVNKLNYVSFLIFGGLVQSFFAIAYQLFRVKFMNEKYWQTIFSFLLAPVNRLKLIIGIGLSESLRLLIITVIFLGITYMVMPVDIARVIIVLFIIILLFIGTLGIGLIVGTFALANENLLFLFECLFWVWSFLSCFYYPLLSLPKFIQPLAQINPVYHGLTFIREIWFGSPGNIMEHIIYILLFAVIAPIVGVFSFNRIIKNQGVTGY